MRWLPALAILFASLPSSSRAHADDLLDRLAKVPGLTVLSEDLPPALGFRFLHLSYTQPIDHDRPRRGTFEQQLTLLHRSFDAPTVAYTTGYELSGVPFRAEVTGLLDGNQVETAQRFFPSSRPEPTNWRDLDIYQAAADHHRLFQALQQVYPGAWISTGASKGGMTTVYHRRFFPDDVDGSVVYVAPNDVDNDVDRYDEFLENVGDPACRKSLRALQRRALSLRKEAVELIETLAADAECTFELIGSADKAYELSVSTAYWGFWQYDRAESCEFLPDVDTLTDVEILDYSGASSGLLWSCDQDPSWNDLLAYQYQAGTELGWPERTNAPLARLLRYPGLDTPRTFVPDEIPLRFDPEVMRDIDRWVRREGSELIFVYGENDPWSAEPFELGAGTRDSASYTVLGGNHGATLLELDTPELYEAANTILRWVGEPPLATPRTAPASGLDPLTLQLLSTPLDGLEPFFRRL